MISHFHRTVFVHIPKCGGQSVEQAFLTDLGLSWELRAPLLLRPNDDPRLGPPRLAHLLARDYASYCYLSPELFASYYSFAVLRDPAARALSLYNYLRIAGPDQRPIDVDTFLFKWLARQLACGNAGPEQQNAASNHFHFVRPQVDFVTAPDGGVMVKDLFMLERLKNRFPEIQAKASLKSPLQHRNKSAQLITPNDLAPRHLDFIREVYAADYAFIASFGGGPAS
ncbi:sulfotransferase family 2 domain-containing protein [Aestuariivirga sp.]|uniref:sulfotransferase family 2 domain-containing protein n=1 Tax=Aestuariivirga sp. TaxID=2650926 RepID=UPI0025B90C28|nr:sulfotransferase family 2 domain-containing protein [Aestuariivirga sp.]MCA3554398.1 sulfotransferase family 2 domain-containing protein [Aestuariivirga sp.]